jgi:hypothetical protein
MRCKVLMALQQSLDTMLLPRRVTRRLVAVNLSDASLAGCAAEAIGANLHIWLSYAI